MAHIVTAEAFIGMLRRSKLIEIDQLKADLEHWKQTGVDLSNARAIATRCVQEETLTRWQADKLLQGKHRGFFLGKYRLLTLLGTGGMSSVYLAEHVLMRRQVAIKVLPQSRVSDASYLERFHREAQAVASLDHPNIVRAYDVNQEGKVHFLVMEYVAGNSLQELIVQNTVMDFVEAVEYIRQAAKGLEHAHQAGLIHRDIKPANLLVETRGVVKLLDLGLARFFRGEEESSLTLKYDEKVLGTTDYLSPEQALDSHDVDTRADIYSLGCTFYFLITGHPPFPEGTLAQRLMMHQTKEPSAVETEREETPPELAALIKKMMRKKPEQRFQSADEVVNACTDWLEKYGGESWREMKRRAAAPPVPTPRPIRKKRPITPPAPTAPAVPSDSQKPLLASPVENPASESEPISSDHHSAFSEFLAATSGSNLEASQAEEETAVAPSRPSDVKKPTKKIPKQPTTTDSGSLPFPVPADAEMLDEEPNHFDFHGDTTPTSTGTTGIINTGESAVNSGGSSPSTVVGDAKESADPQQSGSRAKQLARLVELFHTQKKAVYVSAAVLLVGIVGVVAWPTGAKQPEGPREAAKEPGNESPSEENVIPKKPGYVAITKSIGPRGDFQTISAALEFARKQTASELRNAHIRFNVEPGQTFPERIVIDNTQPDAAKLPQGIHFIVKEGTATLAPSGTDPVISIIAGNDRTTEVRFFQMEGFQINAGGAETAIRLAGIMPRCEFRKLKVSGFTKTGLSGDAPRAFSNDHILLAETTFQPAAPEAVGIRFERGKEQQDNPAHIQITGCRFLGPMRAGIEFAAPVRSIGITGSIFSLTKTGIDFTSTQRGENAAQISRNSFFKTVNGIRFATLSQIAYGQFRISRNAFIDQTTAAVRVENGYAAAAFWQKFSSGGSSLSDNRSNKPLHSDGADIFRGGRTETAFQFKSIIPTSPRFLLPTDDSGHTQVGFSAPE